MRILATLSLLILFLCCKKNKNELTFGDFNFYENEIIETRLKDIVKSDSAKTNCFSTYKSFDNNDSLVSEISYNKCQSNMHMEYLTRHIYGKDGNIILIEIFNMYGKKLKQQVFNK